MGLAASQGRYLALTARNNDLMYEAHQIAQQRLALAQKTQAASEEYNAALNNTLMYANTADGNKQVLTYDIITSQDPFSGLGLRIVDLNGNVVVPSAVSSIEVTQKNEQGVSYKTSVSNKADFINTYMSDLSDEQKAGFEDYSLEELASYYKDNYKDSGISVSYISGMNSSLKNEDESYLFDDNCKDSDYLQKMLESGEWVLERVKDPEENTWESFAWQGYAGVSVEEDRSDDAAAESKYNAQTAAFERQDKMLEMRLEEIQTEQKALEKEMDSVKNIIKKNVETSFKTFT